MAEISLLIQQFITRLESINSSVLSQRVISLNSPIGFIEISDILNNLSVPNFKEICSRYFSYTLSYILFEYI